MLVHKSYHHIGVSLLLLLLCLSCTNDDSVSSQNERNELAIGDTINIIRAYGTGDTYCSFTSLVKRKDSYFLAFREGTSHVSAGDYGVIRVLQSKNCTDWTLVHTVEKKEVDLRDPNLSIMPDSRLLLVCGGRKLREDGNYETRTYSSVETVNGTFDEAVQARMDTLSTYGTCAWIWKITWNGENGYGVCYRSDINVDSSITLFKTKDGRNFDYVSEIPLGAKPSETKLQFLSDGTCVAFIRCSLDKENGYFAKSVPPYKDWQFKILDIHIAGEDFIVQDDKYVVLVSRQSYYEGDKTCVFWGDLDGNLRWNFILPARLKGDDTSYAGIIDDGDKYVISYHTMATFPRPAIFVVKIPKSICPTLK